MSSLIPTVPVPSSFTLISFKVTNKANLKQPLLKNKNKKNSTFLVKERSARDRKPEKRQEVTWKRSSSSVIDSLGQNTGASQK